MPSEFTNSKVQAVWNGVKNINGKQIITMEWNLAPKALTFQKYKREKSLKAGRRRELRKKKKTSKHFSPGRHLEFIPGTLERPERHHFFTQARQGCPNRSSCPYRNPRDQVGKHNGITASIADAQCLQ